MLAELIKMISRFKLSIRNLYRTCSNLIAFYILLLCLLLICGDIEPNPGPERTHEYSEKTLSIFHCNIRSLRNKLNYIADIIEDYDVVFFTETHLDSNITDYDISIMGFETPVRKDRNSHGGGIIMYFKNYVHIIRRQDLEHDEIESMWFELKTKLRSILININYRSERQSTVYFWQYFDQMLKNALDENNCIICLGDLNKNFMSDLPSNIRDIIFINGLINIIDKATHFDTRTSSSSLLDPILVTDSIPVLDKDTIPIDRGISDHDGTYVTIDCGFSKSRTYIRSIWDYKRGDYDLMKQKVLNTNWEILISDASDVHVAATNFTNTFINIASACIPTRELLHHSSKKNKRIEVYPRNPKYVEKESPTTVRIRIKNIPLSADDGQLIRYLQNWHLEVLNYQRERLRIDGFVTNCQTGDRIFYVEPFLTTIPRNVKIGKYRGLIFYKGQTNQNAEIECTKCLQKGHKKSDCNNDWKCKTCGTNGHISKDCTAEFDKNSQADSDVSSEESDEASESESEKDLDALGICKKRSSLDKSVDNYGNRLLLLCKDLNLLIANGRLFKDKNIGALTCKESTVVDYCIMSPELFTNILDFEILPYDPMLSDVHNAIYIEMSSKDTCMPVVENINVDIDDSSVVTKCKWENDKYHEFNDCIDEAVIHSIVVKLEEIDTDLIDNIVVNSIVDECNSLILQAASKCDLLLEKKVIRKVDNSLKKRKVKKPWFNRECAEKRKLYHRAKNYNWRVKTAESKTNLTVCSKEYKRRTTSVLGILRLPDSDRCTTVQKSRLLKQLRQIYLNLATLIIRVLWS
ncbi:unnamed protein product [Mytilus edulis]|uniref:CCHC-type domain-containing protein n=1 Tax=Mytilus edulis TaxID=6550 RepID=A0A8S3SC93_MYTED|nr:unnamed protein product [Mytilus edulis]CAG2217112.1 unnamed protein product [Mytilus edulis]